MLQSDLLGSLTALIDGDAAKTETSLRTNLTDFIAIAVANVIAYSVTVVGTQRQIATTKLT